VSSRPTVGRGGHIDLSSQGQQIVCDNTGTRHRTPWGGPRTLTVAAALLLLVDEERILRGKQGQSSKDLLRRWQQAPAKLEVLVRILSVCHPAALARCQPHGHEGSRGLLHS
jgi:hypothetical protein